MVRPRGLGWQIAVSGLAIIVALMVLFVVVSGNKPSTYERAHMAASAVWHYPAGDVAFALIFMAIEFASSAVLLCGRWAIDIWWRALAIVVVQFFAMIGFGIAAHHGSRPLLHHLAYLLFTCVFLALFALAAKIAAVVVGRRRKSPDLDEVFD